MQNENSENKNREQEKLDDELQSLINLVDDMNDSDVNFLHFMMTHPRDPEKEKRIKEAIEVLQKGAEGEEWKREEYDPHAESLEIVYKYHSELIERLGLKVEFMKNRYLAEEPGATVKPDLVINISDGGKFVNYLSNIDVFSLNGAKIYMLERLYSCFVNQIIDYYDKSQPEDEFLNLAQSLKAITGQYRRLSENSEELKHAADELVEYSAAISGRYLKEFLQFHELCSAEFSGDIDLEAKYDKVPRLHQRYSVEEYQKMWTRISETAEQISQNKNARPFVVKLIKHFQEQLPMIRQEVEQHPDTLKNSPKKAEYIKVLDAAQKSLGKIKI